MSAYRVATGWGNLERNATTGPGELPTGVTPLQALASLTHRFGGGLTLTLSRNRNVNYHQDIGQREFTIASTGMYECDFNVSGLFTPEYCDWLQYAFNSDEIVFTNDSTFTDATGTAITSPTATTVGYVTTDGVTAQNKITYAEYQHYMGVIGESLMIIKVFKYQNLDGVKMMDIGFVQNNTNTTGGGYTEVGVLCGCAINTFSISYENGSDAAIQMTVDGHALCDYIAMNNGVYDYNSILDDVPKKALVAGCISESTSQFGTYQAIAQTDSSSITITNNLTRLGNCLKTTYSAYAMSALTYEVSTSTYSNDANKYKAQMYGYDSFGLGTTYFPGKQPVAKAYMRIRADDTDANNITATTFLDVRMKEVYVGGMDNTYDVENAIMDEPSLRPVHVEIVVGYTP